MMPLRHGGPDTPENLVYLCIACHDFIDRGQFDANFGIPAIVIQVREANPPRWAKLLFLWLIATHEHVVEWLNERRAANGEPPFAVR